ncbi:hypothetical protein CEE35_09250 [Candidatus Aerophobetes bacterium Ae_b3b]|nr:MAG: hypothetical protein CEE35_09250 [Candidatus Aerophobetes bacterium Ae_b3b]
MIGESSSLLNLPLHTHILQNQNRKDTGKRRDVSRKIGYGAIIIIFGATGDLTKRKLIPALYNLYVKEIINDKIPIVCVARRLITKDKFTELLNPEKFIAQVNQKSLSQFLKQVYYYPMDLQNNMTYSHFAEFISRVDRTHDCRGGSF